MWSQPSSAGFTWEHVSAAEVLNQKLNFNKIPRWFLCPLMIESYGKLLRLKRKSFSKISVCHGDCRATSVWIYWRSRVSWVWLQKEGQSNVPSMDWHTSLSGWHTSMRKLLLDADLTQGWGCIASAECFSVTRVAPASVLSTTKMERKSVTNSNSIQRGESGKVNWAAGCTERASSTTQTLCS